MDPDPKHCKINPNLSKKGQILTNFDVVIYRSAVQTKVGSGSGFLIRWFPGSGSKILDFPFKNPDPV